MVEVPGGRRRRRAVATSAATAPGNESYNGLVARAFQLLADQAFSRTAGAPLVGGNAVRLLKNGTENYPAWLDAINQARRCVGDEWTNDPSTGRQEWRDTGVMIQGPAVADVEAAFAEAWATTGAHVPPNESPAPQLIPACGDVSLRVVGTMPATAGVFKLDQLVASVARETLWITGAYFVGVSAYVTAPAR